MTIEELLKVNADLEAYNNGIRTFKAGLVDALTITDIPSNLKSESSFIARAKVNNPQGGFCETSAIFRGDDLVTQNCDCPHYEHYGDLCKHLVALLLAVQSRENQPTPTKSKITDYWTDQLLKGFQPNLVDPGSVGVLGQVKLTPKLSYDQQGNQFSLEFTIGIKRPYVLRSVNQFAERMIEGDLFRYGKDLEFIHTKEQFTKDSQFYLEMIMDANTTVQSIINRSNYYIPKNQLLGRELPLTPNEFDHFFSHVNGQHLSVSLSKLMVDDFLLATAEPPVVLNVKSRSDGNYQITSDLKNYVLYKTNYYCYIIHEKSIYRCSNDYATNVVPILYSLSRSKSQCLNFSRDQLSSFIGLVYPLIKPLVQVVIAQQLLADLTPNSLAAQLYFDYPHPNTVRGKVVFNYGDIAINPLDEPAHPSVAFRDKLGEYQMLSLLQKYHFSANEDEYMLLGEEAIYEFLTQGLNELLPLGQILVEDKLEKMKSKKPFRVAMDVTMTKGIIEIKFDEHKFSKSELVTIIKAYQKGKKYIILSDNTFLDIVNPTAALIDDMLTDFDLTSKDLGKATLKVPAYRALYLDKMLDGQSDILVEKNRPYKDMVRDIGKPMDTDFAVPENLQADLRYYQLVGYRWLRTLAHYGFGGILADDMGLGKTIQAIALLLSTVEESTHPSIIVAPTSLIYNWQAELDKFAPSLSYIVISGHAEARKNMIGQINHYQLVITSYDSLKRDIDLYSDLEFDYCIADEAQYIKNHYTQNAQAIKALSTRVRFALTGTPMENSLADLWSIMDFCMPGYLLRWQKFKEIYEIPITRYEDTKRLERLQQQVAPFLLRRVKKEVLKELPDKIETTLYAQLSLEEEKIYHAQLAQSQKTFLEEIAANGVERSQIKILALLTRLRQACCHPALFLDNYNESSSKLTLCLDIVQEKISAGSQTIIFSQFTSMLDLIQAELDKQGIEHLMLTGSTKSTQRMTMVNQFNNNQIPVFLISLKAGGVGLNLVAADTVIHFDPWWNVSAQNQATDRAHRIGQDKKVHVIKLIAKDTIEEKIEVLQNKKKDLTDAVINEGQTFISALKKEEIADLFDMDQDY